MRKLTGKTIESKKESHADKLRELLNTSGESFDKNSPSIEYLKSKHKVGWNLFNVFREKKIVKMC